MLGIRAIWIINLFPEKSRKVIFFRKFPTVEKKMKAEQGSNYVDLPSEEDFLRSITSSLGLTKDFEELAYGESAANDTLPVISLKIREKQLWPILLIEQNSHLFCCMPGVRKTSKHILYRSTVTMGFALLLGISRFFPAMMNNDQFLDRCTELDLYLTMNIPFGTPINVDLRSPHLWSELNKKQGGWKHLSNKVVPSVTIETSECVRSSQHIQQGSEVTVNLSGSVSAKLDSFSPLNEISVSFEQAGFQKGPCIDSVLIHPCVQTFTRIGDGFLKRLWFYPSQNDVNLCIYTAKFRSSELPVSGVYKIKGDSSVELSIQLKLNENMKNSFSVFEVTIPFFNRGQVQSFEFKASQGYLCCSEDKYSLKWNVGGKFQTKSLDAFLVAKVDFGSSSFSEYGNQFCCDKNSYIQIQFKQLEDSLFSFSLDPKSITTSPACKIKFVKGFCRYSNDYQIWNTFGEELPFPVIKEVMWPKEHF